MPRGRFSAVLRHPVIRRKFYGDDSWSARHCQPGLETGTQLVCAVKRRWDFSGCNSHPATG